MRPHLTIIMVASRGGMHLLIHPQQVMEMIRIHLLWSDVAPGNFLIPVQKAVTENREHTFIR
ncbi:hypothetical protein BBA71_02475 [Acetobacter pasteurianus]|nr:hypothetical protein BBA71_02475 [Acetobacter pasteurianus]